MKKLLPLLLLSACTTVPLTPAQQTLNVQQQFLAACVSYSGLLKTATAAQAKLTPDQIKAVSDLDKTVTPLCLGTTPTDPTAAITQVTAAITTLTILGVTK